MVESAAQDHLDALTPDTTLGNLPAFACDVPPETPTGAVCDRFDREPNLPGVLVMDRANVLGVVSRGNFLEQMSRPFIRELYLRRPVRQLLDCIRVAPLVLPAATALYTAAEMALRRPAGLTYEPIAVAHDTGRVLLLDTHVLLLAQSRMLAVANQTIRRQKEEADAANRAKSNFLASMSHEIRTPMTAILGFTENLLDLSLTEMERSSAVRTILRHGEHLLEIVNDILDLSKIEAGKIEVERLNFDPAQVVADVVSVMRTRADAKKLPLRLSFVTAIPRTILSDATRLRQVLLNLLANAIKFTDRGHVELRVRLEEKPNGSHMLCFDVCDTGIGMDTVQLARIFEPFTQADVSTTRRFGGTGLGLTICRRLARLLGGDVTVHSEVGNGSTFTLSISPGPLQGVPLVENPPAALAPESLPAAGDRQNGKLDGRILLAEDEPDNQMLISSFLRKSGLEVVAAENGQAAVEAALAADAGARPFDVVLMDMFMPVLDGYEATRRLRAAGYTRPIVALTANAMGSDRQKCLAIGCDDYAIKPINRRVLLKQIAAQIDREQREPLPAAEGDSAAGTDVILDRQLALERAGDDANLMREVAELFLSRYPHWLQEMATALNSDDRPLLRRLAHTLKNSAENVGGPKAAKAAYALERAAADGNVESTAVLYQSVRAEFGALGMAMRKHEDCLERSRESP